MRGVTVTTSRAWPVVGAAVVLLGGSLLLLALVVAAGTDAGVRVGAVPQPLAVATLATTLLVGGATVVSLRDGQHRRASGCLWAGAGGLLPIWATAPVVPAPLAAAALATPPLTLLGATMLGTGWVQAPVRLRVVTALVAVSVGLHLLAYDPFRDPACAVLCERVNAPAAGLVSTPTLTVLVAALVWAAAAMSAASVWRARPVTPLEVTATSLVALLLVCAAVSVPALPTLAPDSLERTLIPSLLAASLPCLGLQLVWWQAQRTRHAVRDVMQRLGEPQASLDTLPDPMVGVQVATPEGRWVDLAGEYVPGPPPALTTVPLGADVRLLVRRSAAGAAEVVGRLGAADLLAVSNARLAALTRAHRREVRESQRRIIALSDHERLRIERDLHDGAQQRLVGVKIHLRLAESSLPAWQAGDLAAVEQQVQTAIERLRSLAHGVFPRLLTAEGLVAALEDLASRTPMLLDADALRTVEADLPLDRRTALYSAVIASVPTMASTHAPDRVEVRGSVRPGWVTVRVAAPTAVLEPDPTSLQQAADRVGAVGGRLTDHRTPGGWELVAEVPCESS